MKTYMANPDKIKRKWYVVDAEGCTLGRLASEVAKEMCIRDREADCDKKRPWKPCPLDHIRLL